MTAAWEARIRTMRARRDELVAAGLWRGGPRTLLAATGAAYQEQTLTAGLAWLLRPDGHHGLGFAVLDRLVRELGITRAATVRGGVRVETEDQRAETKADLVVYGDDWTIVVEAKTFAAEQPEQLDRLHRRWRHDPAPRFVFLTRGARRPRTARESAGLWRPLTWREVAVIVREAEAVAGGSPGVRDYLATLEIYHDA